jgi:hypothetical protein
VPVGDLVGGVADAGEPGRRGEEVAEGGGEDAGKHAVVGGRGCGLVVGVDAEDAAPPPSLSTRAAARP